MSKSKLNINVPITQFFGGNDRFELRMEHEDGQIEEYHIDNAELHNVQLSRERSPQMTPIETVTLTLTYTRVIEPRMIDGETVIIMPKLTEGNSND